MEFVKTGISGFDDIAGGGLVKNRTILVQGDAGTGKTTFGLQYLVNGAQKGEHGLLLSLEYDPQFLIEDMENFGWPVKKLIDEQKLSIVTPKGGLENPSPMTVDDLINFIYEETGKINAQRVVIDSLSSLEVIFHQTDNVRRELVRFTTLISELDCTTLLISELQENQNLYTYLSHGVINLYYARVGANRLRAIEVTKMRGVLHSAYTHSMSIEQGEGVVVLPTEIDFSL